VHAIPVAYASRVPIRVVLADDNLLLRQGVRSLLEIESGIEVVDAVGDLDALLAAAAERQPDVVVTDIRMPPTGTDEGVRAASVLRERQPEVGVVVLSQYDEPEYALALLGGGSERRAYLLKERVSDSEQLVGAIRAVASGGSYIDPKVVEALIGARARAATSPLAELTARELEVLEHMAQGKNNAAIADALVLTPRAVEKHINSIFSKLPLAESPDADRRVKAVLLFLSDRPTRA
jgi:DNA-binding NarL/FixJ family response regulator